MNQLSDVLTAISHPSRRAILEKLSKGPATFLEIAEPFDTALNSVTKHLKILSRAGLIDKEKRGREVFISLQGEPLKGVAMWVNHYERFWTERINTFQQHFKGKKQEKNQ